MRINPQYPERDMQMCLDVLEGKTYKQIGEDNSISSERVRQILERRVRMVRSICRLPFVFELNHVSDYRKHKSELSKLIVDTYKNKE